MVTATIINALRRSGEWLRPRLAHLWCLTMHGQHHKVTSASYHAWNMRCTRCGHEWLMEDL